MITSLFAQDYRWPIRASQSLAATFCEYRSGHLHAGIDIKTWGEMEVPCLAIGDGYIERISVNYHGYGRGLFLRLNDGNMAVYGHLELFTPELEDLIHQAQLEQNEYSLRRNFAPNQFQVKSGQIIGYSGTSGTEHPHLHFEIRDSLNQAINPQLFYPGIKDTQAPVLDEILFYPANPESRINGSKLPVIYALRNTDKSIQTTGPFRIGINAHDRADGTYNKCNIYSAETFVNDSLIFSREFDRIPMKQTDFVDLIYPGIKGKRNWHFMTMFTIDDDSLTLFSPPSMDGTITPEGLFTLNVRVADIGGNYTTKGLVIQHHGLASWKVEHVDEHYRVTRSYSDNSYERFQFYTVNNTFIPIAQTFYRLNSTTWIINTKSGKMGIRALGALGSELKWIIPPPTETTPQLNHQWISKDDQFILRLESEKPYIFPLACQLRGETGNWVGELTQISPNTAETELVSIDLRAGSKGMELLVDSTVVTSLELKPLHLLSPGDSCELSQNPFGFSIKGFNSGSSPLYLDVDTLTSHFDGKPVVGAKINVLNTANSQFNGQIIFKQSESKHPFSVFSPGKKDTWRRLAGQDTLAQVTLDLTEGDAFFLLQDSQAPTVKVQRKVRSVKRGTRLVFSITDNSGFISHPKRSLSASIDGQIFFPDYNPLRHELSFHVPQEFRLDRYVFELTVQDESGNITNFSHPFTVNR